MTLNKAEAAAVVHEIFDAIGESGCVESVSLDDLDSLLVRYHKGFQIKIKCKLDSKSKASVLSVLKKRHLSLSEEKGYVLISKIRIGS